MHIEPGQIPFPDGYFDMVWVNLVLGGIVRDEPLIAIAAQIERVLAENGILFLVENTSATRGPDHWRFRSDNEYLRLFPNVSLRTLESYRDVGEEISVMVGARLPREHAI
jgi:SAM-dependent methyltransferase